MGKQMMRLEPKGLKQMKEDTDTLAKNLLKTSRDLIERTEELNQKGFQDGNFEPLYKLISERKKDLEDLNKLMGVFSERLERGYQRAIKYKGSNIN